MRREERIQEILSLLNTIWSRFPDLRFHQLIDNLLYVYDKQNKGILKEVVYKKEEIKNRNIVSYMETSYHNAFHLEDEEFLKFLKEYVGEVL